MPDVRTSICRSCHAQCTIHVELDGGKPISVTGVKGHPIYHGFACAKGRQLPAFHSAEQRLLTPVKRRHDGQHEPISSGRAMDEISDQLAHLVSEHGPRSIALYIGTHGYNNLASTHTALAWMKAIGSPMVFTSVTIDQPGKAVSAALHGTWLAGCASVERADVWLTVGANPVVSMLGPPSPAYAFKSAIDRGMALLVIDPRRTELARRARIHLQPRPGTDPTVLAGLIHVILEEGLHDEQFVGAHGQGLAALRAAVQPFSPDYVEERADIPQDQLREAARVYAEGRRGVATVGTGPNMSGRGNLTEYLARVLMTLCGHWLQAGDPAANPGVFIHFPPPLAQAVGPSPAWGFGEKLRVRGFTDTVAGLPTAALPEEILMEGEGQVKALICLGGNPAVAWPDQLKTLEALDRLELLVCIDPVMSASARLSSYVIAPKLTFEQPGNSVLQEFLGLIPGWGYPVPYGHVTPVLTDPPAGSDVIDDWELFYGLARRQGLDLSLGPVTYPDPARQREHAFTLDMENKPTSEELWEALLEGSPVSLDEVRMHPEGHIFEGRQGTVQPAGEGGGRLEIGDPVMMAELTEVRGEDFASEHRDFAFRLISRRLPNVHNSSWYDNEELFRLQPYNPAFMNPADLEALGLSPGTVIEISSARATIRGVVGRAPDVRPGAISMSHCWGDLPGEDDDVFAHGGNTGRLSAIDSDYDPYTGISRMSTIPVNVRALS